MPTLKAYVNDGVCSRIVSDFNRIEVDGETVWAAATRAPSDEDNDAERKSPYPPATLEDAITFANSLKDTVNKVQQGASDVMTMFPRVTTITFEPSSFVDGKMPGQKTVTREMTINVCNECGAELEYDAPTYTCPECGETYSFKTDGVFGP